MKNDEGKQKTCIDSIKAENALYSGLYQSLIQYIDINDIKPDSSRSYGRLTLTKFMSSITETGFLRPIFINSEGSIIDGRKRLAASAALGITKIPTVIAPNPLVFKDDLMIAKLKSEQFDFFECAKTLKELTDRYLYSQENVAFAIGKSQSFVANKLRLLNYTDEERELIKVLGVSERHCRTLLRLRDPTLRIEAIRRVSDLRMNVRSCEEYVSTLADNDDPSSETFERDLRRFIEGRLCAKHVFSLDTSVSDGSSFYTIKISK